MRRFLGGYTVIEVMIFLAITAVMFVAAATAVNGRQQAVQYSQSVRDLEGQMQDVLNDVAAGYFAFDNNYRCEVSPSGSGIDFRNSNNNDTQGSSDNCVNVGKIVMFNPGGDEQSFGLGTLVGKRSPLGSVSLDSATASQPTMAYEPGGIDLTEYKGVRYGLRVTKIYSLENPSTTYSSLIVASGFNATGGGSAQFGQAGSGLAGVQDIDLYATVIGSIGDEVSAFKPRVDRFLGTNVQKVSNGVGICLFYPDRDRRALLTVGEGGTASRVTSQLDYPDGGNCG